MNPYLAFLVYLLAILGFVALTLWLNKVIGPKPAPTALKLEPFECGAIPIEQSNVKAVPVKYYAIAIVFILFDLEGRSEPSRSRARCSRPSGYSCCCSW